MNELIKIAELFEKKLISVANSPDASKFEHLFSNYELMSEALDSLLEGLNLMVEKEPSDNEISLLLREQKELLESAIMSVYPQISAIDAKLQEKFTT